MEKPEEFLVRIITCVGLVVACLSAYARPTADRLRVKPVVPLKSRPFALKDIRLLDGPFKHATELNAAYLLKLEPDRLLHNYRKFAGLDPKAEGYGGWETRGIAGHSLGHYLSACSLMYASTGDPRFRDRVNYIADELDLCQKADGDGYVAGIPDGSRVFAEVAAGNIRTKPFDLNGVWVPWYNLHKLFAGLIDAHRYCASDKALAVATRLADWAIKTTSGLSEEQFQRMLACEHGGMNEVLAKLYALTGKKEYLKLSRRFHHKAVLDPLANRVDCLPGLHANTQIPKLIGLAQRYELTGDENDRIAAEFFWDRVVNHHSYVTGGHSNREYFGPPDKLNDRLGPDTTESCNVYNMLKLTRRLFGWRPEAQVADFYERALYNHILPTQHPDDGRVIYNLSLEMGGHKRYQRQFSDFTCCVGTGMENHSKYGDSIYFHDGDGLFVNLFIASKLKWKQKGLSLTQETRYPDDDTIRLSFACEEPVHLALRIRYPYWAETGIKIEVNGQPREIAAKRPSYVGITQTWKTGDTVEVQIPMSLRLETMPDNPNRAAVMYGPLVLAGELGPVNDPAASNPDYVPVLITNGRPPSEWLSPVKGKPNTFRTVGVGKPRDVTLYPFYRMHNKRYTVYWDFLTTEQWNQRQAQYRVEQKRLRELEARSVDVTRIGETRAEKNRSLKGERTSAGEFNGRKWRHATNGGWFSFDVKVLPKESVDLLCTYWGSDSGGRVFDILVSGKKIATQALDNNKPGRFFDVTYPIPEELTRDKDKVTVRFEAHPDKLAGGLFGCRTIRRSSSSESGP